MAISLDAVGIDEIDDFTLMTDQSVEKVAEAEEPLIKYDGTVADDPIELFDPTYNFEFSGIGDLPAGLVVATDGGFTHDSLSTGRTIVTNVRHGEQVDGRNSWNCSGENCPAANVPA